MSPTKFRHSGRRRDEGAVLVLVTLLMLSLLLIVAIVIDLGVTRGDRRSGQASADSAAATAARTMGSDDPVKACEDALAVLAVNLDTGPFTFTSGTCASFAGACSDTTPRVVTAESGSYAVRLEHPVVNASALLAGTSTIGSSATPINSAVDGVGCRRFGVQVTTSGPAFFGGVAGSSGRSSTAHAVGLLQTDSSSRQVAALLLLERVGCGALQVSGQGSVVVRASSATVPGIIAADSAGQQPPCSNNNNANGWVIYGTALPAASGGGPSITAEQAAPGIPGVITTYADAVGGRGGYIAPSGLNVASTPGTINSRSLTDARYNGVNPNITTLHAAAYSATAAPPTPVAGVTMVLSGRQECNGNLNAARLAESLTATTVFADCSTFSPSASIFPAAQNFFVRGKVELGNGDVLALPVVRNFFVRGCSVSNSCGNVNNANAVKLGNGAALLVNNGSTSIPSPLTGGTTCEGRQSPAYGGTTTNTTKFATLGGQIDVGGGFVRLCQTTLYVGDNTASYTRESVTSTGTAPENYPAVAGCSTNLPCPKATAATTSGIQFGGGSAGADWSAPNQLSTVPTDTDRQYSNHPFEDLALWSETSTASSIKGQGNNSTRGIYFLPNAPFELNGQGTQSQPLNAQFFVRTLNSSGQGTLFMRPNPNDSITIEVFGGISLIR